MKHAALKMKRAITTKQVSSKAERCEMPKRTFHSNYKPSPVLCLPFVGEDPDNRSFWKVKPSGDYGVDCRTGEDYALAFLEYSEASGDTCLLPTIVKDMAETMDRKEYGIEVGFLSTLESAAHWAGFSDFKNSIVRRRAHFDRLILEENARGPVERRERARKAARARGVKQGKLYFDAGAYLQRAEMLKIKLSVTIYTDGTRLLDQDISDTVFDSSTDLTPLTTEQIIEVADALILRGSFTCVSAACPWVRA